MLGPEEIAIVAAIRRAYGSSVAYGGLEAFHVAEMAAGVTDHVWSLEEAIGMMEPNYLIGAPARFVTLRMGQCPRILALDS